MSSETQKQDYLMMTTDIVSAYVSSNTMPSKDVGPLMEEIYKTIANLGEEAMNGAEKLQPAVPVHKSVTDKYLICLEDGKKLKMLKRHLKTAYDMTPSQYREKWGLPSDYPMVAPDYAKHRSALAKNIGLGKKTGKK